MPRNIPTNIANHLLEPTVILFTLILITRQDGIVLGFTNCDRDIIYGGNTYYSAISLSPSGIKTNADLTTDQMDIIAAIDSVYITEEDIESGRYDQAKVQIYRINPNHVAWGVITELSGYLGEVTFGDGQFHVAVNSLGKRMSQNIGDVITPVCRVRQLGDAECKVNLALFSFSRSVAGIVNSRTLTFNDTHATGYYDYGKVKFLDALSGGGNNYSIEMEIKTSTGTGSVMTIVLQEPTPQPVTVGDNVILEAGCDRRPITCRNKFSNLVNIHCEPYCPGNSYLIATGRPPS